MHHDYILLQTAFICVSVHISAASQSHFSSILRLVARNLHNKYQNTLLVIDARSQSVSATFL